VLNCDVQEELGKVSCVGFGFIQVVSFFAVCALLSSIAYTRKNTQLVSNLQQTCSNAVPTTCQQDALSTACSQLVDKLSTAYFNKLLSSCNSTICQQVVSDNLVAT
jgi:hypothetical protein